MIIIILNYFLYFLEKVNFYMYTDPQTNYNHNKCMWYCWVLNTNETNWKCIRSVLLFDNNLIYSERQAFL